MDMKTKYLGFELPHPLIAGAGPITGDVDMAKRLAEAGAAALVMPSLFEEQIVHEQLVTQHSVDTYEEGNAEALSYLPSPDKFILGPDEYLDQVRKLKAAVDVPLIGSLNGSSVGGWLEYAKLIEQAGADALELNVYYLGSDIDESSDTIEKRSIEMVREVKQSVKIPVAVKLSPYYTALASFVKQIGDAGADGLVLFNRFYQPDIDVEELEVQPCITPSRPTELSVRLRWLAILSSQFGGSMAATGGVHSAVDAIKAVMCGADAVQMTISLLQHGPDYIGTVRDDLAEWLDEHEYESLEQAHGSMSKNKAPDPTAYDRANYIRTLQSWRV